MSLTHTTGAKITPILPTLPHHTPLCGSVKKNTDSLVKGMILFDQGGGGRGGGKRSWSKVLPPVSPWSACFLLLFAREMRRIFSDIFPGSKILAGNSPAGPPRIDHLGGHSLETTRHHDGHVATSPFCMGTDKVSKPGRCTPMIESDRGATNKKRWHRLDSHGWNKENKRWSLCLT